MPKSGIVFGSLLAVIPIAGAATAIAIEKTMTRYQYVFGPAHVVLIALIGAIQSFASAFFTAFFIEKKMDSWSKASVALLSHACVASALFGLTAAAAKVNLLAARLSLFATIALGASSLILNFILKEITAKILANIDD